MPSEPMNIQEQGFRSSLFGFDKNDVLAYMNALANEAQQHELEYNRQLQQLQSKLDELRSERGTADSRMEALKAELAAATQRADTAEAKRREADEQLETIKKKTASFQSTQRESQKNANIWQLKCHDLQQQVDELQKQLTAARALNTAAAPAAPTSDLVREAKLEAGKILADARLYAESAERELKQQAETQKNRMAENARSIASGVMLVRERLARVDERLSAATLDLDGLTQAIYQALDQTEAELKDLGTRYAQLCAGHTGNGYSRTGAAAPRCRRQACRPVSRKARRASARQGQGTARAPHGPCCPGPPSAQHPPPDLPAFAGSDRQIGPGGAISLYIATRFRAGWFLFRAAPPRGKAWFVHKPFLIC